MDKERKNKILAAAQQDKYHGSEYEHSIYDRSVSLSALISFLIGILLFVIELVFKHSYNIGFIAIALTAISVHMLYSGCRGKSVWRIIIGVILVVLALIFVIGYIGQVIS